jgi:hypothetical protein
VPENFVQLINSHGRESILLIKNTYFIYYYTNQGILQGGKE